MALLQISEPGLSAAPHQRRLAVGIDLGTTNSLVATVRSGQAETQLLPAIDRLPRGRRILIVTPVPGERLSQSPWARAVRIRTREWRAALDASPRLQPIGGVTTLAGKNTVRARVYEVI